MLSDCSPASSLDAIVSALSISPMAYLLSAQVLAALTDPAERTTLGQLAIAAGSAYPTVSVPDHLRRAAVPHGLDPRPLPGWNTAVVNAVLHAKDRQIAAPVIAQIARVWPTPVSLAIARHPDGAAPLLARLGPAMTARCLGAGLPPATLKVDPTLACHVLLTAAASPACPVPVAAISTLADIATHLPITDRRRAVGRVASLLATSHLSTLSSLPVQARLLTILLLLLRRRSGERLSDLAGQDTCLTLSSAIDTRLTSTNASLVYVGSVLTSVISEAQDLDTARDTVEAGYMAGAGLPEIGLMDGTAPDMEDIGEEVEEVRSEEVKESEEEEETGTGEMFPEKRPAVTVTTLIEQLKDKDCPRPAVDIVADLGTLLAHLRAAKAPSLPTDAAAVLRVLTRLDYNGPSDGQSMYTDKTIDTMAEAVRANVGAGVAHVLKEMDSQDQTTHHRLMGLAALGAVFLPALPSPAIEERGPRERRWGQAVLRDGEARVPSRRVDRPTPPTPTPDPDPAIYAIETIILATQSTLRDPRVTPTLLDLITGMVRRYRHQAGAVPAAIACLGLLDIVRQEAVDPGPDTLLSIIAGLQSVFAAVNPTVFFADRDLETVERWMEWLRTIAEDRGVLAGRATRVLALLARDVGTAMDRFSLK